MIGVPDAPCARSVPADLGRGVPSRCLALALLLVAGCSDSTGPGGMLSVSLDPPSAQIAVGETAEFILQVGGDGQGGGLEWSCSSSAPARAAPETTPSGCRVQGIEPGEALLTVHVTRGNDSGSATAPVEVLPAPAGPIVVARLPIPGGVHGVIVDGGLAYVGQLAVQGGLAVVDVQDPTQPVVVGSIATPGAALGFTLAGDRVYLAAQTGGLQVVGVSNPQAPTLLGTFENPPGDGSSDVAVQGTLAYHAAGCFGVRLVEFSDPAAPVNVGSLPLPGCVSGIIVSGDRAWATGPAASVGLTALDVSDPATPLVLGTLPFAGLRHVVPIGTWLMGWGDFEGIRIFDPSDPANPALVGSVELPGWIGGIYTTGILAFVPRTTDEDGAFLDVIALSDPSDPELVTSIPLPGSGWGVWVSGEYAYVASNTLLDIIDLGAALEGILQP